MELRNVEMQEYIDRLKPLLERRDSIGYAAARNTRILLNESQEFSSYRDELVMKYGEKQLDENGQETGEVSLKVTSPNFRQFVEELTPYAERSHEVNIYKLPISDAIGVLTGQEILDLEWMFEEIDDGDNS